MDKIESPRKLHSAAIPPMYRMHYNYIATLSVLYAAKFMRRDLQTIIVLWMDTVVLILFLIPSSALMCDRMIFYGSHRRNPAFRDHTHRQPLQHRLGFGVLEGVGIEVVVHGGVCIEVNDFEGVVDGCAAKATQIVAKTIVN